MIDISTILKLFRVSLILKFVSIFLFWSSFIFLSCSKFIQPSGPTDEEVWLTKLTSSEFSGRKTGTEGARKTTYFIYNELSRLGYSPYIEDFIYRDSIIMRNVIVEIPGCSDSIIVVGAHYDGAVNSCNYQAANDNASGVIALLSIAKKYQSHYDTVLLCFWDGEESTEGSAFNGSSYFTNHFDRLKYIKWYCNIDCCGRKDDPIYLYYSKEMQYRLESSKVLSESEIEIIKKLQLKNGSDYVSFRKKGIPIWGWNDYNVLRYIHSQGDIVDSISIDRIQKISNLTIKLMDNI